MPLPEAALAVAALAVVCLGALTITSQRTELLVGSYHVNGRPKAGQAAPAQPHGYGTGRAARLPRAPVWLLQRVLRGPAAACGRDPPASSRSRAHRPESREWGLHKCPAVRA